MDGEMFPKESMHLIIEEKEGFRYVSTSEMQFIVDQQNYLVSTIVLCDSARTVTVDELTPAQLNHLSEAVMTAVFQ